MDKLSRIALALTLALALAACQAPVEEEPTPIVVNLSLSGDQEVPPTETAAAGEATVTVTGSQMVVDGSWEGFAATLAHVHGPAAAGANAGVVFTLTFDNPAGTFGGTFEMNATQLSDFEHGLLYINVHSAAYPAGEIRGQIVPEGMDH